MFTVHTGHGHAIGEDGIVKGECWRERARNGEELGDRDADCKVLALVAAADLGRVPGTDILGCFNLRLQSLMNVQELPLVKLMSDLSRGSRVGEVQHGPPHLEKDWLG